MDKFPHWFNQQFLNWERTSGKRKTISEFADYLKINRSLVSFWLNGSRKPSNKNIELIATKLGFEIYDVLDKSRPDPDLYHVQAHWVGLPTEAKRKIRDIVEKYSTKE